MEIIPFLHIKTIVQTSILMKKTSSHHLISTTSTFISTWKNWPQKSLAQLKNHKLGISTTYKWSCFTLIDRSKINGVTEVNLQKCVLWAQLVLQDDFYVDHHFNVVVRPSPLRPIPCERNFGGGSPIKRSCVAYKKDPSSVKWNVIWGFISWVDVLNPFDKICSSNWVTSPPNFPGENY